MWNECWPRPWRTAGSRLSAAPSWPGCTMGRRGVGHPAVTSQGPGGPVHFRGRLRRPNQYRTGPGGHLVAGRTYPVEAVLADAEMESDLARDAARVVAGQRGTRSAPAAAGT